MTTEVGGQQDVQSTASEYNALAFVIQQLINKIQTVTLVKVIACTNDGGVSPVGTVDVQPLVNQRAGDGTSVPHGTIYKLPYFRLQGGVNALIMDPQPGDIGMCGFCSRDISAVKKTKAQANPGSARVYNFSDGLYFGGLLNGAPTQYVAFTSTGVTVVSPGTIKLQAPSVDIEATTSVTINSPLITIEGGGTSVDGKVFLAHLHTGVTSGGSDTGPPL